MDVCKNVIMKMELKYGFPLSNFAERLNDSFINTVDNICDQLINNSKYSTV